MKIIPQKKHFLVVLLLAGSIFTTTFANKNLSPLLTNVPNRQSINLNGKWNYIVDRYETGYYDYRLKPNKNGFFKNYKARNKQELVEYNFDASPDINIPHDWNTWDEQLLYYEGTVWFQKSFEVTPKQGHRYFLYFGAVNYHARVYLNGTYLGEHKGGFTPFNFEVSEKLKQGENSLVLMVNNLRKQDEVPTVNTDWWNYGGITRDVFIIEEKETFIRDFAIGLKKGGYNTVEGWVLLDGKTEENTVSIEIPELKVKQTIVAGNLEKAAFTIKAKPELWSPDHPKQYTVVFRTNGVALKDDIAFRNIEAVGNEVHLNGKPVFLKGICMHEEAPFRQGRLNAAEEARTMLTWAKEMNCNFVRLAHYPHNEYMVREAEKMGIMLWSELPVYWTISFDNNETLENAKTQLNEMITRDRNRGAIIIWSVANETPRGESRNAFLTEMASEARRLDNSRMISMAMEKHYKNSTTPVIDDPLMHLVDIVSFNTYIGWYDGLPEKCARMTWEVPSDKPVFISEFGGGALQGYHGEKTDRWTEEYQEDLYRQSVAMFDKVGLAGTAPWILVDFLSPRRLLPGIQDGFNRKGLISDQGIKKKAFFIMQEWYEKK